MLFRQAFRNLKRFKSTLAESTSTESGKRSVLSLSLTELLSSCLLLSLTISFGVCKGFAAGAVATTFGTYMLADFLSNFIQHPTQKVWMP
jgi:hypothetical protein